MKGSGDASKVVKNLKADGIEYVRFEMPDLHGTSRSKTIPIDHVEGYAKKGLNMYGGTLGLDTASNVVPGTGLAEEINYADSKLFPDFETIRIIPWVEKTAKVICDAYDQQDDLIQGAPRYVLSNLLSQAKKMGYEVTIGHEFEFYLLDAETRKPLFEGLHIFNTTRNNYVDFTDLMLDNLRKIGVDIITHNSEYASSQFETNFSHAIGLVAADNAFTFKNAVKELAHRNGFLATFMSKPYSAGAGCGCHIHMGLLDGSTNVFSGDKGALSKAGDSFTAGILKHAKAMMPLIGPTPNCYHRLKPHTFAPSNISWGIEDRTALVRAKPEGDNSHIEMRGASGVTNPYLTAAATLAAGLLGIKNNLALDPEVDGPCEENESLEKLPSSLEVALAGLKNDDEMCNMLGADFIKLFTTVKEFELARFRGHVTDWERDEYMEVY